MTTLSDKDEQACVNTDREIWREREGDYYADSIHVTEGGGIGINCGGSVFVMPVRDWYKLAMEYGLRTPLPECGARSDEISEWIGHLDLHLTEHDDRHRAMALKAAWPHVRRYLYEVENERNTWRELAKNAESARSTSGQGWADKLLQACKDWQADVDANRDGIDFVDSALYRAIIAASAIQPSTNAAGQEVSSRKDTEETGGAVNLPAPAAPGPTKEAVQVAGMLLQDRKP